MDSAHSSSDNDDGGCRWEDALYDVRRHVDGKKHNAPINSKPPPPTCGSNGAMLGDMSTPTGWGMWGICPSCSAGITEVKLQYIMVEAEQVCNMAALKSCHST